MREARETQGQRCSGRGGGGGQGTAGPPLASNLWLLPENQQVRKHCAETMCKNKVLKLSK